MSKVDFSSTMLWLPSHQLTVSLELESANNVWLISDTHFDHTNIIRYAHRPFGTTDEMNAVILDNLNSVVRHDDLLIFLGDMSFGRDSHKPRWWLEQLNGQKIYIKGSHDKGIRPTSVLNDVLFVADSVAICCEGKYFLAIHDYHLKPTWWNGWVVHGHNHDTEPFLREGYINVGVEVTDYKPTKLSTILDSLGSNA